MEQLWRRIITVDTNIDWHTKSFNLLKEVERINQQAAKDILFYISKEYCLPILDLWPSVIQSVEWRQYTPYFNDGGPCIFQASGSVYITFGDIKNIVCHYEYIDAAEIATELNLDLAVVESKLDIIQVYLHELNTALYSIRDFLRVVGDHVIVRCQRDGLYILDFKEHD